MITIDFRLTGNGRDWLNDTVSMDKGSTVYDLLVSELTDNGYTYGGNSSYISYITNPSGTRLGEFTAGRKTADFFGCVSSNSAKNREKLWCTLDIFPCRL